MKDRLAGLRSTVDDQSVAVGNRKLPRQTVGSQQEPAQEGCVLHRRIGDTAQVFTGNNDDVGGRLWIDVFEGQQVRFLRHDGRGHLVPSNAAKQTRRLAHACEVALPPVAGLACAAACQHRLLQ